MRLEIIVRTFFRLIIYTALMLAGVLLVRAGEFDSAGVKIHYVVKGQGEPVILIHGLGSSAAMNWGIPGITAAWLAQG
jgi:hypothetical protein